jgi:hypothetical protein
MSDYRRIVDELRSFAQASDQTYTDSLKQLAAEYGAACEEVNLRLRRCEDFLQKGLRSEAIHLAQAEPVLLDVLAALDFPERAEWEKVALAYGLPPPPRLRTETAAALNQAYADERPLEHLLRQHRLLALSRAPLGTRLTLMRQIAAADLNNPIWAEDIATFERVRIKTMRRDAERAIKRNDLDALFFIGDELENFTWSITPDPDVVAFVRKEVNYRKHIRLRKSLEKIADELRNVAMGGAEHRARALRQRWNELNSEARLERRDPIARQAAPALKLLDQLDKQQELEFRFQAAVEKLEEALASGASQEQLVDAYYETRKYKRALPGDLRDRYEAKVEMIKTTAARKERFLLMIAAVVGILAVIGFLVFALARQGH